MLLVGRTATERQNIADEGYSASIFASVLRMGQLIGGCTENRPPSRRPNTDGSNPVAEIRRWLGLTGNSSDSLAEDTRAIHCVGLHEASVDYRPASFLILIADFVTIEGMKFESVTPMHHLTIVVSSARRPPPSGYRA
jgi:hypothetical protein